MLFVGIRVITYFACQNTLWGDMAFAASGHCFDATTMQPPRGLQFILGTPSHPAIVDTITMANLVCTAGNM